MDPGAKFQPDGNDRMMTVADAVRRSYSSEPVTVRTSVTRSVPVVDVAP
jgi:hypothetical protein